MSSSDFDVRLNEWFDSVEPRQAPALLLPSVFRSARETGQSRGRWRSLVAAAELAWPARTHLSPAMFLAIILGILILALAAVGFAAGWLHLPARATMSDGLLAVQNESASEFVSQIRFIDPATGQDVFTTPSSVRACGAHFSPDGSRYAFLYQDAEYAVYIAVAPATPDFRPTLLAQKSTQIQFDPAWAPDGSALLATMEADDGRYDELWILPADGSPGRRVTDVQASYSADWSPSGEWIAFVGVGPLHPLYLIRPDGRDLRLLRSHGVDWVAWSPVRDELAYSSSEDGQLHVISPNGAELFSMIDGRLPSDGESGIDAAKPVWSDDGTMIALAMASYPLEPRGVLRIFDIENRSSTRILLEGPVARVAWSASGDALAAVAWTADSSSADLWEVPISDGEPRLIAQGVRARCMSFGAALSWQRLSQ